MDHQAYKTWLLLFPLRLPPPFLHSLTSDHFLFMSGFLHVLSSFMDHVLHRSLPGQFLLVVQASVYILLQQKIFPWFPQLAFLLSPVTLHFTLFSKRTFQHLKWSWLFCLLVYFLLNKNESSDFSHLVCHCTSMPRIEPSIYRGQEYLLGDWMN